MKTKFNSKSDVMHVYAQQEQFEGRSGNVFFYGKKIYSYGYHYLLAEIKETANGDEYILINDSGYSVSTSKHISEIRQATRQYKQLFVTETDKDKVLSHLKNYLLPKLLKATKPEIYISEAIGLYNKYVGNCLFIGIEPDSEIVELFTTYFAGENCKIVVERAKIEFRDRKERERKEKAEQLKINVEKFYNYETDYIYNTDQDFIRVSIDKTEVETSQRVKVPIKEAKILYKLIQAGKDIKGFRIGYYTVISINGVLKVGCHNINIESMHKVGNEIINL